MAHRTAAAAVTIACLIPTASLGASLGVHFSWAGTAACSGTPPAFSLTGVPNATKYLDFQLVDLDKLEFVHGGGQIPYAGSGKIPAGAFSGTYQGPCPPPGISHTYQWTVKALDESKTNLLASGTATRKFPP
jgi:hypothetical protein